MSDFAVDEYRELCPYDSKLLEFEERYAGAWVDPVEWAHGEFDERYGYVWGAIFNQLHQISEHCDLNEGLLEWLEAQEARGDIAIKWDGNIAHIFRL